MQQFARPEYVWIRETELPHNPSGKVLKNELRKEVKERIDAAGGYVAANERESKL